MATKAIAYKPMQYITAVFLKLFLLIGIAALPAFAFAIDTDGDGVDDSVDAFPNDPGGAVDTDNDGKPDTLLLPGSVSDSFEAGVFTSVPFAWSTGGSGNWIVQSVNQKAGHYAAKSPSINSWLQFTHTAAYSRTITFWSGVNTGLSSTRRIRFYIDGVLQYADGGLTLTWTAKSFTVSPGTHTFQWKFDGCVSSCGPYYAIVDDVRITAVSALVEDTDDDNDGVADGSDAFPLNAAESFDTDLDGIGNNADLDDDGDGVPDYIDADSLNATINSERTLLLNNGYKGSVVQDAVQVQ